MSSREPNVLKLLLKRLLISLPFFVVSFYLMSRMSYAGPLLLTIPAFLLAGPLIAMLTSSSGSVFFPMKKSRGKPPPMFSIPAARIREGDFGEALEIYRDMILKNPRNLELYRQTLELLLLRMQDPDMARKIFHDGLKNLKDQNKKKTLAQEYRRFLDIYRDDAGDRLFSETES